MRPSKTWMISFSIVTGLCYLAGASRTRDSAEYSGAQYLAYNGTVSATISYAPGLGDYCETTQLIPYVNSYIYVGVNPPWDPNPFFFELYHIASEWDIPIILGFTDDSVYNLAFSSSAYACWLKLGGQCSYWQYESEIAWKSEVVLNLNETTTVKTKVNEEDGYTFSGNQTSYIKNETERATVNGVDILAGCFTENGTEVDWKNWIWNETSTWSYSVSFANGSATALLKTEAQGSTVELAFKGDRIKNETYPDVKVVAKGDSNFEIRYTNNSDFHFKKNENGWWQASANEFPSSTISTGLPTSTASRTGSATISTASVSSTGVAEIVQAPGTSLSFLLALGGLLMF